MAKKSKNSKPIHSTPQASTEQISAVETTTFPPSIWSNTRWQALFLALVAFLLYANTLTHNFCQDDAIVITDNMFTQKGISGLGGIFSYDTFYGFFKEAGKDNLVAGGRYRPFTLAMFAVEYQFFGKNPFIGHLFNVIWFAVTCVLLFFLLKKLFPVNSNMHENTTQYTHFIPFAAALLFAVHPIHTEVVANIKGRDEIMALLGSLAAVWFSIEAVAKKSLWRHIAAGCLFFIGLLSKENAITFVVIVPLIYWFFLQKNALESLKPVVPFAMAALLFLILRGVVIGNQFGGEQKELMNNPFLKLVDNQYVSFNFSEKIATIFYTLGKYVQLLFVPYPLTHDYYPRHINIMNFADWRVILSGVTYAFLLFIMVKNWRSKSPLSFGIAFYLITLSIVSNLVFSVGTNMAERFAFMPSVGFCLVVAYLLAKMSVSGQKILSRLSVMKPKASRGYIGQVLLVVVTLLFSAKTVLRNAAWLDDYTLFTTDIKTSFNSAKLLTSVGGATIEKYSNDQTEMRGIKLEQAIGYLERATKIHQYKNPYLLLGNAHLYLEHFDESIKNYETALTFDPNFNDAKNNLALAYREAGKYYGQRQNNIAKAVECFNKSLALNPNDGQVYSYLGTCYGIAAQYDKAAEVLEKALALRFDKRDAENLSLTYRNLGNIERADFWAKKTDGK